MNKIVKNIPNAVTCVNIACGTLAIIFALSNPLSQSGSLSSLQWAWILIGLAAIADFFDGFCARALRAYSDLGKELDSLCDAVSFGVAPAACVYSAMQSVSPDSWIRWAVVLIPVLGVLRLAKFNIDTRQTSHFIGLPIPANALFWIGYSALLISPVQNLANPWIFIPVLLLETWLMVSNLKLFSLKFKTWGWKGNALRWTLIVAAPVLVAIYGVPGLLWLIVLYLIISLFAQNRI